MDSALKIVTEVPLRELWRDNVRKAAIRIRPLYDDDIRRLLRTEPVQFVVADVGAPLHWIPLEDCFAFWKVEVRPHLSLEERVILNQYPGEYCYCASLWDGGDSATPLVVLEKHH